MVMVIGHDFYTEPLPRGCLTSLSFFLLPQMAPYSNSLAAMSRLSGKRLLRTASSPSREDLKNSLRLVGTEGKRYNPYL